MAFKTVAGLCSAEIEEKRSRFIATLVPYSEFDQTLAGLRSEHRKANHHVTAVRHMNQYDQIVELGKDDGEPAGTSGMPTLKTLIGADLMDVGVIVTRYFGGTKLGTGGLARAYSGASNAAIQIAQLKTWHKIVDFSVESDFSKVSEIEALISKTAVTVLDRIFNEQGVVFKFRGPEELVEIFNIPEYSD